MKVRFAILAAAAGVGLAASAQAVGFTAYNDFSLGAGIPANTTTWGAPGAASNSGVLLNAADGASTGVTVTLTANSASVGNAGPTAEFTAGTPAANAFGANIVNNNNAGSAPGGNILIYASNGGAWSFDVGFSGLTPGGNYTIVAGLDRGLNTYDGLRYTKITMVNADGSATENTVGGEYHVPGGGVSISAYNTVNGYVAQWSNINPGPDGSFTLHYAPALVAGDAPVLDTGNFRGYGPSGIKLTAVVPEPTCLSLLGLAALPLLRRRRV